MLMGSDGTNFIWKELNVTQDPRRWHGGAMRSTPQPRWRWASSVSRGNASRMGHVQQLRRAFTDIENFLEDQKQKKSDAEDEKKAAGGADKKDETPKKTDEEEPDRRKQAMIDLLQGKLKAYVYCQEPQDVLHAFEFQEKYKFPMVLVVGPRCTKAADAIAKKGFPVVLDSALVYDEVDEDTGRSERISVTPPFYKAGVKLSFQTDASTIGPRYLWYQAATAVKQGMPREDALRAITQWPAEILGVADEVGTLEKGKDANLLLLTGDPLDSRTWVDTVVLDGKVVYERSKDEKLKKLTVAPSK